LIPGARLGEMMEMFGERRNHLVKILHIIYKLVTYGTKVTLNLSEDEDTEVLGNEALMMDSVIKKSKQKIKRITRVGWAIMGLERKHKIESF
jgi:hypothetical protein